MADHRLPRTIKNAVFTLITEASLEPSQFTWADEQYQGDRFDRILHTPTGHWFRFGFVVSTYGGRHFQSQWTPDDWDGGNGAVHDDREGQIRKFVDWLRRVRDEHVAPDLWATIVREGQLVQGELGAEDERYFTDDERRILRERLAQIEAYLVQTQGLDQVHQEFVRSRLEFAAAASERLTVKDWKILFLGLLTSIIANLMFNPGTAHDFLRFAATQVSSVFGVVRGFLQ